MTPRLWKPIILALALLLGGCAGSLAKVEAVEKGVVEPGVDTAYDQTVKRWCRLPVDVHGRALERRTITARSLTDNCPEWRAIRDAFLGEQLNAGRPILERTGNVIDGIE